MIQIKCIKVQECRALPKNLFSPSSYLNCNNSGSLMIQFFQPDQATPSAVAALTGGPLTRPSLRIPPQNLNIFANDFLCYHIFYCLFINYVGFYLHINVTNVYLLGGKGGGNPLCLFYALLLLIIINWNTNIGFDIYNTCCAL